MVNMFHLLLIHQVYWLSVAVYFLYACIDHVLLHEENISNAALPSTG